MDVLKGFMMDKEDKGNFALKRSRNIIQDQNVVLKKLKEKQREEIRKELAKSGKQASKIKIKNSTITKGDSMVGINGPISK
jgi:hypothetical protein